MKIKPESSVLYITLVIGMMFVLVTFLSLFGGRIIRLLDPVLGLPLGYHDLVHVNREQNIPTWMSSIGLALSAELLLLIAYREWKRGAPFIRHWFGLGVLFLWLSLDEFIKIHESFIRPMRRMLNITDGVFYFAWIIPGSLFVLLVGIVYFRFVMQLPDKTRRLFILAGALFVAGALGMEAVGGYYYGDRVYSIIVHIEEFMEMMGITVFLHALLTYLIDSGNINTSRSS